MTHNRFTGLLAARPTRPSLQFVNPRPLQKLHAKPDPSCSCLRRRVDRGVHVHARGCPGYARAARGLRGRRPAPLRALYPARGLHHILHDSKGALRQRRLPVGHEARHAQQQRALLRRTRNLKSDRPQQHGQKFYLQIGAGLLRTNSEHEKLEHPLPGDLSSGFNKEIYNHFRHFAQNEANGKSVTKTMLQYERCNRWKVETIVLTH
jgi:hypothetical protein